MSMNGKKIIIKYGELWLKSEPVRRLFARTLAENARSQLKSAGIAGFKLERTRDMLILEGEKKSGNKKSLDTLKRVFGISWFAEATETKPTMKSMEKAVLALAKKIGKEQTFAIRASRQDKSLPFTSRDIENEMGKHIDRKVNLSKPDITIFIEARKGKAYVYLEKIKGAGGLPYGVSGRALSLLSGGIDSPVASWMIMKRGCDVHLVYFHPELFTGEKARDVVKRVAETLRKYSPRRMSLSIVPFSEVQKSIVENCERRFTCVLCRRAMYRTAQVIAGKTGCKALVTGESLAQVASQTLDNLSVENEVLRMAIFRPLIGMDKEETILISKKIGTYEVSIETGCCALSPKKPSTKARLADILAEERKIRNLGKLVEKAAEDIEMLVI
jgi:thiamine biosynthesis protein ThiI